MVMVNKSEIDDSDELIRSIHEQVIELNDDKDWRDALMTWGDMLDLRYDLGKEEGKAEALASLVKDHLITPEEAKSRLEDPALLNKYLDQ